MKYEHLSVDIETLGTKPGSVISSIGAVAFGERGLATSRLNFRVSVLDSLLQGLRADEATLDWWRKQSVEARAALFAGPEKSLSASIVKLQHYMSENCLADARVWMKGPSFDGVLLNEASRLVGVHLPWKYFQERDVRTICDGVPEPKRQGVYHRAVDDAVHQAEWVRQALAGRKESCAH